MKKRILSLLLAAALCIGVMPAYAAQQDERMHTKIEVNPMYADVVAEQDIRENIQNGMVCYANEPEKYFNSIEEAGAYLREEMEDHRSEISFNIYLGDTVKDIDYRDIYSEAVKETGVPTQGDYIRGNTAGYGVSFQIIYDYNTKKWHEKYIFEPIYFTSEAQEQELTETFHDVMAKFDFNSKTTYQKIKMLYTYVCDNVKYDYDNLNDNTYTLKYSTYAALVNKKAVCQGYATLMYRMLWEAGIPARVITSETHGWNIVKLGDVYYNIDSTWDAGHSANPNYFLCTNDDYWFNVSDHQRNPEYTTDAFNKAYPMASKNYQPSQHDLNGHTWDSGKVTTQPTCTKDGIKTYTCTVCKTTKTETVKATGHKVVTDAAVAATCTTAGKTAGSHCSVCGTVFEKQQTIPAAGHKKVIDVPALQPTCVSGGHKEGSHCSVCGEILSEPEMLPNSDHTWDSGKVTTQPTCTENGVKTYTCTVCKTTKTETIKATEHKVVTDAAVAATCGTAGKTEGSHCETCNTVIKAQQTIPATGKHTWDSGKVTTQPTCTEDGVKTYTCTVCKTTKTETIKATGHKVVTDAAVAATCGTAGKTEGSHCETCNIVIKAQQTIAATGKHTWDNGKVTTQSTCTEDGIKTYTCTVCKTTKTETIKATEHKVVTDAAVAATCGTAGKTEGSHCETCNTVIKAQQTIAATGNHTWDSGKVTTQPTCTEDGIKTYTCTVCKTTKTETIKATEHKVVTDAAVEPTYTTEGKTEGSHCSVCGEVIKAQKIIPALKQPEPTPTVTFTDVDATQYYAQPVQWAVEREITRGTSDTTFSPNATCTRAQIVTFLWRANHEPEPTSNHNPFNDVFESDYYYKAVLWAVEKGITTGTSDTTFSPNMGCTRAQVATFLWRANGKPSSSAGNPFSDVDVNAYYGTAVLWAVEKEITNGMGEGTFAPDMTCTRGQIVTFLYRCMA